MHIGVLIIKLNTNERMLLVLVLTTGKPNATHRFKIRIIYVTLLILYSGR